MDEQLDDALECEAARSGTSKAALIRECVAAKFSHDISPNDDPLSALLGISDDDPVDDIDAVIYRS
jgi:hypothetical protein